MSVRELDDYLESLKVRNLSPATVVQANYMVGVLLRFLDERGKRLQDVDSGDLEAFRLMLVERSYKAMTVDRFMMVTRLFFRWLEESQRIFLNPARDIIVTGARRPILFVPSEEQVKALLAQPDVATPVGIRDRAFMETLYSTGARLQELMALAVSDVDLERGTLRLMGKGRRERVVPLGRQGVYWIQRYLVEARPKMLINTDEPALWVAFQTKRKASGQALQMRMKGYCKAAGLPLMLPHAIRRACATHMLRNGAHPVQIQMLLGHAGLSTLSQYLRVTITDLKKVHRGSKPGQ